MKAQAQPLYVVKETKKYRMLKEQDTLQRMCNIKAVIPAVVYDIRYATRNNFTGKRLYTTGTKAYLRLPVLKALKNVQQELQQQGYGLKIFDAYRPYRVTRRMWKLIQDERYVAHPAKGSGHNRGLAVDVTLINLASGEELNMGTGYDHFSDTAHHSFTNLNAAVLKNRRLLKSTLEKHGFKALETEWWHYSWPNDRNYAVLDLTFRQLARLED